MVLLMQALIKMMLRPCQLTRTRELASRRFQNASSLFEAQAQGELQWVEVINAVAKQTKTIRS